MNEGNQLYYRAMDAQPLIADAPDPYGEDMSLYAYPDYPDMAEDFTIAQNYADYSAEEHAIWAELYACQAEVLPGRASKAYLQALEAIEMPRDVIPNFAEVNQRLDAQTGWQLVAVPGLIPTKHFFEHLAKRRFPVTRWIRSREQFDYLQEPDLFHDFYGHVPLLANPVFADYMQAYGQGGLRAMGEFDALNYLARLYWYTVEFGLIEEEGELRAYGAGILSSKGETIYSVESDKPQRIGFDVQRILRTDYKIDDYQRTYFVAESFEQMLRETRDTDFTDYYKNVKAKPPLSATDRLESDKLFSLD